MNKVEKNAKFKKYDSDKYLKLSNNCPTPPPPPFEDEDGWSLQFCKWWGWNWVRKEQNYVTKIDHDLLQTMKNMEKMREAGDINLENPKRGKNRYFKYIRNFFIKLKHTSSLKKMFHSSPANHCCCCCCCANCNCNLKENIYPPFFENKRCHVGTEHKGTWSKDDVDNSLASININLCSSLKDMELGTRKKCNNDVLLTKNGSYQQTQGVKKTKHTKYYHLVCNNCYPRICCCNCHKQASGPGNTDNIKHCFKDSIRTSANKPKQTALPPSGDYNHQQYNDNCFTTKRSNFLNFGQCRPQTHQVHRCTQNKECGGYARTKEKDTSYSFYTDHTKRQKNQEGMFETQTIPEKENIDCLNNKNRKDYKRWQSSLSVSESSYSDDSSFRTKYHFSMMKGLPRTQNLSKERLHYYQDKEDNIGTISQIQERKLYSEQKKDLHRQDSRSQIAPEQLRQDRKHVNYSKNLSKEWPVYQRSHPKRERCHVSSSNSPGVPSKKSRISDTMDNTYRDWNRVTFGKKVIPKFGAYKQKYPQMRSTRSDILDRHYSLKIEEEFFSPVSGKIYNLPPRSILDPEYYASSSLLEPINDDLKYLENLEGAINMNRSSRFMLDAVCEAILSNKENKNRITESTLIGKFSYPNLEEGIYRGNFGEPLRRCSTAGCTTSQISEIVFMEKVEALVKSILNSKLTPSYINKGDNKSPIFSETRKTTRFTDTTTDSQQSTGNSALDQFSNFNNLFEKMDEATIRNKANVEKIQETIQSLPGKQKENLKQKDSGNRELSVTLSDLRASMSNEEKMFQTTTENSPGPSNFQIKRRKNFNMQHSHSFGYPQSTFNSKIPIKSQKISNSQSILISSTRRGIKNRSCIKHRRLKTRIPIKKKM